MKLEEAIGGTSPVLATDKVAMTIKNSVDPDDMDSEVCPMVFCSADQADKESFTTVQEENTFALFTGIATAISVSL
mgnify:FL=1